MHTLSTDQVAYLLDRWAAGSYAAEAAVQLLAGHRTWLERRDFQAACLNYDHDGASALVWVDWDAVPGFLDDAGCSSSEARILRLAAELSGVDTGWTLTDLLSSLDDRNSRLVVDAIAHVFAPGRPAMTADPTTGVVARWTTRRRPRAGDRCDECGTPVTDIACARCGQLAGQAVGMLATVVDTPAGRRLVIAQRTGTGDWTPVQTVPATAEAVRAVARPGATGPQADHIAVGGLW